MNKRPWGLFGNLIPLHLKNLKIGASTKIGYIDYSLTERLQRLYNFGFTIFELYPQDVEIENIPIIKKAQTKMGFSVVSCHLAPSTEYLFRENRENFIRAVSARIEIMKAINCHVLTFHTGCLEDEKDYELFQQTINSIAQMFPEYTFLIENQKSGPGFVTLQDFKKISYPFNFGILLDLHHARRNKIVLSEFIKQFSQEIQMVHFGKFEDLARLPVFMRQPIFILEPSFSDKKTHRLVLNPSDL